MGGSCQFSSDGAPLERPDFNVFSRYGANYPWRSHALWFLTQMARWGQLREPVDLAKVAHQVYRPELFRQAAVGLGLTPPTQESKHEGIHSSGWTLTGESGDLSMGPDLFFDGMTFNPHDPIGYLVQQPVASLAFSLNALREANPLPPVDPVEAERGALGSEEANR